MKSIHQEFNVTYQYGVHFTQSLFSADNNTFVDVIGAREAAHGPHKVYIILERAVAKAFDNLQSQIEAYFLANDQTILLSGLSVMTGGEACKNDSTYVDNIVSSVNKLGIDRHSYIAVIGGGAIIDMVGYAAAVAHRGIRLIRIPTTVLAQNDAAVGVKNSINAFGKKNFIGTFTPPYAVINDSDFLTKLDDRDWRCGIAEAIKVALIKDKAFFEEIERNASLLARRDMASMQNLIYKCAQMHLEHIAGKDPFERGSSRPLDFGHWSAHKLEYLSNYQIRHGEAVAIGIALDSTYSWLCGHITKSELDQIINILKEVGFKVYNPQLKHKRIDGIFSLIAGLNEFREHLGGKLTIMLLDRIGHGFEVHQMNEKTILEAIEYLSTI